MTKDEAIAAGYGFLSPPPEPDICPFCGKENQRQGIQFGGAIVMWQPFVQRCDCDEAVKYWAEFDRQEEEKKKAEEAEKKLNAKRKKIERLLKNSGLKKRSKQRTFESFVTDTAERDWCYKITKEYANSFRTHLEAGTGLYIEGPNGTGKTHLATAIALQLINEGFSVVCKSSGDMFSDIRKAYDDSDLSEASILDSYKNVDLLIIDDLGKEQCTDWSISILYSIINYRYEDMKPTIITTNYSAEGLIRALTPKNGDRNKIVAIISRLRETSQNLTMVWDDIRSPKQQGG